MSRYILLLSLCCCIFSVGQGYNVHATSRQEVTDLFLPFGLPTIPSSQTVLAIIVDPDADIKPNNSTDNLIAQNEKLQKENLEYQKLIAALQQQIPTLEQNNDYLKKRLTEVSKNVKLEQELFLQMINSKEVFAEINILKEQHTQLRTLIQSWKKVSTYHQWEKGELLLKITNLNYHRHIASNVTLDNALIKINNLLEINNRLLRLWYEKFWGKWYDRNSLNVNLRYKLQDLNSHRTTYYNAYNLRGLEGLAANLVNECSILTEKTNTMYQQIYHFARLDASIVKTNEALRREIVNLQNNRSSQ